MKMWVSIRMELMRTEVINRLPGIEKIEKIIQAVLPIETTLRISKKKMRGIKLKRHVGDGRGGEEERKLL